MLVKNSSYGGNHYQHSIMHSRKKRVGKACDSCRLKKTKCNGKQPCERCVLDNKVCIYTERRKQADRVYSSDHVELIENRLKIVRNSLLKLSQWVKLNNKAQLAQFAEQLHYSALEDDEYDSDSNEGNFGNNTRGFGININEVIGLLQQKDTDDTTETSQTTTANSELTMISPPDTEDPTRVPTFRLNSPESLSPTNLEEISPTLAKQETEDFINSLESFPNVADTEEIDNSKVKVEEFSSPSQLSSTMDDLNVNGFMGFNSLEEKTPINETAGAESDIFLRSTLEDDTFDSIFLTTSASLNNLDMDPSPPAPAPEVLNFRRANSFNSKYGVHKSNNHHLTSNSHCRHTRQNSLMPCQLKNCLASIQSSSSTTTT